MPSKTILHHHHHPQEQHQQQQEHLINRKQIKDDNQDKVEQEYEILEKKKENIRIGDLQDENKILKNQLHLALESIASIEDHFADKQMQFIEWHETEVENIKNGSAIDLQGLKQQVDISHDEIARLTQQLADEVDEKMKYQQINEELEMVRKESEARISRLKEENTRLSLTIFQLAKDKSQLQGSLVMMEHDLESGKTRLFEMQKEVERCLRDIDDLKRGIPVIDLKQERDVLKTSNSSSSLQLHTIPL